MTLASRCLMTMMVFGAAAWANAAAATSTLQDITYKTLPGGRVELRMNFNSSQLPQPNIFTTDNPPRIAIDFPDTTNDAARHQDIGVGTTTGVSAVAAGGRTRVVVELMQASAYKSHVEGNSLVLVVNNGTQTQPVTTAATIDPSKALPSALNGPAITTIDFQRGANGSGRVLINFSGTGANANMNRQGSNIAVDIVGAQLPAGQSQRLNVLDFATPVQSISPRSTPNGAHLDIAINGDVDTSSYQTGSQYVIEVTSKKQSSKDTNPGSFAQPVYTGNRVTFNFQDIPVRSVLQLLADYSGVNMVASDTVGGSITLRLNNVPWDQALDVILRAKDLDKRRDGNVIWIAPQKELADYEQNIADARFKAEDTAPLITTYVPISYGKAQDIAKLLTTGSLQSIAGVGGGGTSGAASQHRGFLSPRGSVTFDQRTNTLLINDTAEKTVELRAIIAQLDRPVQQVLIESRIVIATDDFERDLGVQWGVTGNRTNPSGQVLQVGSGIGNTQGNSSTTSTLGGGLSSGGLNVNLPAAPTTGTASTLAAAILGKNYALDLELSAAQAEGRSEVVSSPRVITANQQEADIRQGQEIGYVTFQNTSGGSGTSGTATVAFKDAVLELKVTPTITADNRVYLAINVNKDSLDHYITVTGSGQVPVIDTRSLNTSVLVDDGQTVVLGGIYEVTKSDTINKVPGLGDIPGLGVLFRSTQHVNDRDELLIFVTPRILSDSLQ
ncbi:type IV pilus secretin family protein [Dyella caseinilytica]|uniref:Type IV pilus secretin PilQ n=1 Tax=Dyella caseinilytica TaxID=1849581 RepID=A0ABX7GSA0_9GAMM|nr:type IV pilus secretin family protein [Dyella caseinilytica]QRN52863.1 type IV pilus secretin PilQ [Dyella caseinilytica]GGA09342.1 fimbrial protein [Dyella caseinilytica]